MNIEILENWFNKHTISIFSIYILSFILIEENKPQNIINKNDVDDKIILILDKLMKDGKIKQADKEFYIERIQLDRQFLIQFKEIIFDVSNNPNLLQKNKWSSKNIILDKTNKCFPCKRRDKK